MFCIGLHSKVQMRLLNWPDHSWASLILLTHTWIMASRGATVLRSGLKSYSISLPSEQPAVWSAQTVNHEQAAATSYGMVAATARTESYWCHFFAAAATAAVAAAARDRKKSCCYPSCCMLLVLAFQAMLLLCRTCCCLGCMSPAFHTGYHHHLQH